MAHLEVHYASLSQLVEDAGSNPVQSRFESEGKHQSSGGVGTRVDPGFLHDWQTGRMRRSDKAVQLGSIPRSCTTVGWRNGIATGC